MGLIVIGQCIGHKTTWIGPAFGYAMQAFGLTAVSNIAITYAVDNFKSVSGDPCKMLAYFGDVVALTVVCSWPVKLWWRCS